MGQGWLPIGLYTLECCCTGLLARRAVKGPEGKERDHCIFPFSEHNTSLFFCLISIFSPNIIF